MTISEAGSNPSPAYEQEKKMTENKDEWERVKETLNDIQPENRCYARVKALIRAGDKLIQKSEEDKISLGKGVFNWPKQERVSDRYAMVGLLDGNEFIELNKTREGFPGWLIVKVLGARQSTHIGDLFRGIYPSTPSEGEEIVLGHGLLFYEDNFVGLNPSEFRETDWLDPHKLYRAHEQYVELFFKEGKI